MQDKTTRATIMAVFVPYLAYAYIGRKRRALIVFAIDMAIWAAGIQAGFYAGGGPQENPLDFNFGLGYLVMMAIVEGWHLWMILDIRKIAKQGVIAK